MMGFGAELRIGLEIGGAAALIALASAATLGCSPTSPCTGGKDRVT
jgi:hypothetical protein